MYIVIRCKENVGQIKVTWSSRALNRDLCGSRVAENQARGKECRKCVEHYAPHCTEGCGFEV